MEIQTAIFRKCWKYTLLQCFSFKSFMKTFLFSECRKRQHPPNGKIRCESSTNAVGSSCYLRCNPGFIPVQQTMTTCLYHNETGLYIWNVEDYQLQCIESVGLDIPFSSYSRHDSRHSCRNGQNMLIIRSGPKKYIKF